MDITSPKSTNAIEGGIESDSNIALEHLNDKKSRKQLTGAKVGDSFVLDPHKISHGQDDLVKILGITQHQVHDLEGNFHFEVKEIKRLTPHENNQELWDKVLGKDVVSTERTSEKKSLQNCTVNSIAMRSMFFADDLWTI